MTGSPLRTAFKALTAGLTLSLFLWITLVPLSERDARIGVAPSSSDGTDADDSRNAPRVASLGELPQARIVGIESEPDSFTPAATAPRQTAERFDPSFETVFDTTPTLELPAMTVSTGETTPPLPAFPERITESTTDPFASASEPIPTLEIPPLAAGTPDSASPFELPELEAPTTSPPDLPALDPLTEPSRGDETPLAAPRPVEFDESSSIDLLPLVPVIETSPAAAMSTIEIARGSEITRIEVPATRPGQPEATRAQRELLDALEQTRRDNDDLRDSSRHLQQQVDSLHAEQRRTLERLDTLQRRLEEPAPKLVESPSRTVSLPRIEPRPPVGVNEPFAAPPPPPIEHREPTSDASSVPLPMPESPAPENERAAVPVWFDDELSREVAGHNGTPDPVYTLTEFPGETCDASERRGLLRKLGSLRLGDLGTGWWPRGGNRCDCPTCRLQSELAPAPVILGMPAGAVLLPPLDPAAARVR